MKEIGVSVLCATYNQEKYIRQALEGFVMQKTTFPFEVIVHDDASTDKTPEIIKQYAKKYPNIIKPIYQKENQYSKGELINIKCLFPKAKGKYLAFCEGDDFWTDENKLQIQYDIMEKNPNCHLCLHKVRAISENGKELNKAYPNFNLQEKMMNPEDFFKYSIARQNFHTSSYFIKSEEFKNYINEFVKIINLFRKESIGDVPMIFYFGHLGGIYYINKIMSKYRMFSNGSWSLKSKAGSGNVKFFKIIATEEFDKYTFNKYHNLCAKKIFNYSIDIAKIKNNRKNLLFKNRKEFFGRFDFFHKVVLLIIVLFPNLTRISYKILKQICKNLNIKKF